MILAKLPRRANDSYGSGAFGASRGSRTHHGIDFECPTEWGFEVSDAGVLSKLEYPSGVEVVAPASGKVTKLGYPYGDDLSFRYVEVTDSEKRRHRVFYVEPSVTLGQEVVFGQTPIGVSQDLTKRYPRGMTPHVHYEIILNGKHINPDSLETTLSSGCFLLFIVMK